MTDPQRYLDPLILAKVRGLELQARLLVEGYLSGMHKSPYHGFSVEFAQHREYVPGDDIKHVDWKVFGRTDRYYVKQYEEETNLHANVLLDMSESMTYKGATAQLAKYEYACTIAAALAFLLIRQQDACGLHLFDDDLRGRVPASAHPFQLRDMAAEMAKVEVKRESRVGPIFHRLAEEIRRRGLVIIVSDLFFSPEDLLSGIQHLRHKRHEVIVFHVMDHEEIVFPFDDITLFRGMEHKGELLAEPRSLRKGYLEAFERFKAKVSRELSDSRCDYVLVDTSEPPAVALSRYLVARRRRTGAR